jgi:hypothetical protein
MKHLDPRPVDVLAARERVEQLELRCAGRRQQPSLAPFVDRPPERFGCLLGRRLAERPLVVKDANANGSPRGWRQL